jgi:hypothetical protein
VNHEAGGFVDDREVLVLEDQAEWYGARLKRARRFIFKNADGDRLTPGEEPGGADRFAIDADELVGD